MNFGDMAPAAAPGAAPAPMSAIAAAGAPAATPSEQIVISNPIVDRLANVASSLLVGRKLQSGVLALASLWNISSALQAMLRNMRPADHLQSHV